MNHTPTPWEYVDEPEPYVRRKGGRATLLLLSNVVGKQRTEDLKHVVKCVNTHDDLVTALENVISLQFCNGCSPQSMMRGIGDMKDFARTALDKLKKN